MLTQCKNVALTGLLIAIGQLPVVMIGQRSGHHFHSPPVVLVKLMLLIVFCTTSRNVFSLQDNIPHI